MGLGYHFEVGLSILTVLQNEIEIISSILFVGGYDEPPLRCSIKAARRGSNTTRLGEPC
jgi:hypothetical protein